jgi:hypothetical protein
MAVTKVADRQLQTAPGSGSDPWTYLKITTDFTTSSATAVDITGLSFTPVANLYYEVEMCLMAQTPTATVGPRPGLAWGTGYQYGVVDMYTPSAATTEAMIHARIGTTAGVVLAAIGGLPVINVPYGHRALVSFRAGTSPTAFKAQMASETAGTLVTVKAGSFLKYRTF